MAKMTTGKHVKNGHEKARKMHKKAPLLMGTQIYNYLYAMVLQQFWMYP